MTSLAVQPLSATEISLTTSNPLSSEGYFVLSWELPGQHLNSKNLQLRQAASADMADFKTLPVAPQQPAVTLTGYGDGSYYFQLVSSDDTSTDHSSNIVKVDVMHHSLAKAFGFFTVGLGLFVTLCASIFLGHRVTAKGAN